MVCCTAMIPKIIHNRLLHPQKPAGKWGLSARRGAEKEKARAVRPGQVVWDEIPVSVARVSV
jgi:hypothetical protein